MNRKEQNLSMLLYISSLLIGAIGVILGIIQLFYEVGVGLILIFTGLAGGILLFAQGKIVQLLVEKKPLDQNPVDKAKQLQEVEQQSQVEEKVNSNKEERIEWIIDDRERESILHRYEDNDQVIDIIPAPFPKYCVIKTEDYIDVIQIKDGEIKTLSRKDVESFPELLLWIEENIFNNN